MLHAPVETTFVTTDPDRGRARVAESYADTTLRVRGDRQDFRLEQTRSDLGCIRIDTFENTLVTEYEVDPLGYVLITRVLDRTVDLTTPDGERTLGRGDLGLVAQPDDGYASRLHGARIQLVGVDLALLDDVVGDQEGGSRRLSYTPLTPARAAHWQRTVDYVLTTELGGEVAGPLLLGNAARMLAAALLTTFDPAHGDQSSTDRADATPALARRAVAFCEANADLDIGVADIARACHASVRSVQLAFRRHLETTPTAYLRRLRLARVRAELLVADPRQVTIAAVAARWGFVDASRFSAQYRAAYGESPRETLRGR